MSAFNEYKNPMRIPDLTPMYEAVRDFVKANQGDKGFICTDDDSCDTIWCIVYDFDYYEAHEYEIKAVRVKNDTLEVLYDNSSTRYDDEACSEMPDNAWRNVEYDDALYYIPTIFWIAENIQEYVEP